MDTASDVTKAINNEAKGTSASTWIIGLLALAALIVAIVAIILVFTVDSGKEGPAGPEGSPGLNPYQYAKVSNIALTATPLIFAPNNLVVLTGSIAGNSSLILTLTGSAFSAGDTMTIYNYGDEPITVTAGAGLPTVGILNFGGTDPVIPTDETLSFTVTKNMAGLGTDYWLIPNL